MKEKNTEQNTDERQTTIGCLRQNPCYAGFLAMFLVRRTTKSKLSLLFRKYSFQSHLSSLSIVDCVYEPKILDSEWISADIQCKTLFILNLDALRSARPSASFLAYRTEKVMFRGRFWA